MHQWRQQPRIKQRRLLRRSKSKR
ncbi:MAG: hypothetical protein ACON5J_17945 [Rubripirellula sp.]